MYKTISRIGPKRINGIFRSLFVRSESTPNPHSMKFIPDKEVLPESMGTGIYIQSSQTKDILKSPLAKKIFNVGGIKGVFLGRDFITVTKESDESWSYMKNLIFLEICDFFSKDEQVIINPTPAEDHISDTTILEGDDEIVATIKELFETRIRPSVQEDGGDIFYLGFDPVRGIVQLRLAGSCVGCPSSSVTLRNGVENMLKHYIPEVKGIEEIPEKDINEEENKLSFHPESSSQTTAATVTA